jgi:hypothetical protein
VVGAVTVDQPPSLDASARAASIHWASASQGELAEGDLVVHCDHGVARYRGRKSINQGDGDKKFLLLEFARGAQLYVPVSRRDLLQKLVGEGPLTKLDSKNRNWPVSYWVEVLPNAYAWPGIAPLPNLPQEPAWDYPGATRQERSRRREVSQQSMSELMNEWRRACVAYQETLHADPSYKQSAKDYFERQNREPQPLFNWWVYRAAVLQLTDVRNFGERVLLIKQYVLRRERNAEKLQREVDALENCQSAEDAAREPIPENVRLFVWRRDKGQCVRCSSRERLEFDHIIPVAAGGSSTERNIQLLCESCNRSKGASV